MASLRPFCAYRPPADRVKRVACPPYDVVTTSEARALAAGEDDSFLHVTRPEIDLPPDVDPTSDAVHERGRASLLAMVERRLLVPDAEPHLYIYGQKQGRYKQTGVVGCAFVQDYLDDRIKKHERTRPDKEDDRTRHITTLEAHDEPVFLAYRASAILDEAVERITATEPVYDFSSDDGVEHRFWVASADQSASLCRLFESEVGDLYVADGHHRSAAAARAHERLRGDGREHDVFLAVLFPHDQLRILPYDRVVEKTSGRTHDALLEAIAERMTVTETDRPSPEAPGSFGIYTGGRWYRATAPAGSYDAADPVARLDCQICQDLILEPVFGITDVRSDQRVDFVGGVDAVDELVRRVDADEASLAIHLHPTEIEQVIAVSDAGRVMPPKSTWFEPKLRSGLFVHTF